MWVLLQLERVVPKDAASRRGQEGVGGDVPDRRQETSKREKKKHES